MTPHATIAQTGCPVCGSSTSRSVLELPRVAVLCNALFDSAAAAADAPVGAIDLVICDGCGTLRNEAFDPAAFAYSPQYENSLHFSGVFQEFATGVADRLRSRYAPRDADILEIGPGNGDFLAMLATDGNRCVGFDPSHGAHTELPANVRIEAMPFPIDGTREADLVCARHVLEHLDDPVGLLRSVARAIGPRDGAAYLEVPDGGYLLDQTALWDVIYEHPLHFTASGLSVALDRAGLDLLAIGTGFGGQYLWAEAAAVGATSTGDQDPADLTFSSPSELVGRAAAFGDAARALLRTANELLSKLADDGPVAVWGAGSKGVMFVNMVDDPTLIHQLIDINPRKDGKFVPCSAHEVVLPANASRALRHVVVLNPLYVDEIADSAAAAGLDVTVHGLS